MSLSNINNSYINSINGLEQFYDEYDNNYELITE